MAERYEDFDRNRNRDRDRDAGQRFEDYRRESRSAGYGQGGQGYERHGSERDYGREQSGWGGREGYGSESRYGGRYDTEASEFGRSDREDWRSRERGGQSFGGGMGSYSGQDWRTERQGSYGGGMGEGFGRDRETWERDRGYGDRGGYRGGSYGQSSWSGGTYGSQGTTGRFTGRGPKGYQRSDERIREDACERLTQHPDVDASEIDIQIRNGEVTLSGSVEDRQQKRTAEDIVENLSGVREVHNQLRISKGLGQRMGEALGLSGGRQYEEGRTTGTASTTSRQNEPTSSRR